MKTALIVEDESVIALDLADQLRSFGYHVLGLARSHQQADELAGRHTPDLAIIDLSLDLRSGLAARLKPRGTKVLFVTGHSLADRAIRPEDRVLIKPWAPGQLAAEIHGLFDGCSSPA